MGAARDQLYDCLLLELARAEFTIVDVDRATGFVRAQRVDRDLLDRPRSLGIYATVLRAGQGATRHVQISSNARANDEADSLAVRCTGSVEGAKPRGA